MSKLDVLGYHVTYQIINSSSLSQVVGLKLESREVPTNLNVTSVLKLQLSKVNSADENEHEATL